jgi:hypothetical protein
LSPSHTRLEFGHPVEKQPVCPVLRNPESLRNDIIILAREFGLHDIPLVRFESAEASREQGGVLGIDQRT